jgi:transcriptional regulator with XRE-family HTH domain
MKPNKIPLGDNIRIARARLGYSQEYVADRLGISKQRYRQLENEEQDSLTFGRLVEIGSILETDIETLMTLHRVPFAADRMSAQDTLILALNQLIQTQQELMIVLQKNMILE